MAEWREVMSARSGADDATHSADVYGGRIEDGVPGDAALAVLLVGRPICLELRALAVALAYEAGRA